MLRWAWLPGRNIQRRVIRWSPVGLGFVHFGCTFSKAQAIRKLGAGYVRYTFHRVQWFHHLEGQLTAFCVGLSEGNQPGYAVR